MILLIQLILAHLMGDFFVQPSRWVKEKDRKKWASVFLYVHVLIHFALILLITLKPGLWKQALVIAVAHLLIDGLKASLQKEGTKRTWFFVDQLLHLITIVAVWGWKENMKPDYAWLSNINTLVVVTAVLFLVYPSSFIIKMLISKWAPEDKSPKPVQNEAGDKEEDKTSLANAGQWIGIMERLLVLIFVLMGRWEGVGFLLAAKSVFRFGDLKDAKDMKLTEYVLIGTFLSFGIAIVTGIAALHLLVQK